jgi:hypothetical protein
MRGRALLSVADEEAPRLAVTLATAEKRGGPRAEQRPRAHVLACIPPRG